MANTFSDVIRQCVSWRQSISLAHIYSLAEHWPSASEFHSLSSDLCCFSVNLRAADEQRTCIWHTVNSSVKAHDSPWTRCDCPTSGPEKLWCPGTWMTSLQSRCCSWWWLGVETGGGGSPEVHDYLHCFECVKLQVVKTAPDSQLLNLLSVSRLVTVLHEVDQCGVVCRLQELDRGVSRCAVVGVQGEEQWGENTALRSSSADRACAGWGRSVWCRLQTSGAWQRGL